MILQPDETVLVIGQGPIGILLAALAQRTGATVLTSDLYAGAACDCGEVWAWTIRWMRGAMWLRRRRRATEGRGADVALVAVGGDALIKTAMDAVRPGGRVMLFASDAAWRGAVRSGGGVHG